MASRDSASPSALKSSMPWPLPSASARSSRPRLRSTRSEGRRALVRAHEVGREGGVGGDALRVPAAGDECVQRALGVVQHLGPPGVGEPTRPPSRRCRRDRRRRRMPRGRRPWRWPAPWCHPCRGPRAHDVQPHGLAGRGILLQPPGDIGRCQGHALDVEPGLRLLRGRLDGREEPVRQHPNSRPSNTVWTCSRSQFRRPSSSTVTGSGMSRMRALSRRLRRTPSRCSRSRSRPCP